MFKRACLSKKSAYFVSRVCLREHSAMATASEQNEVKERFTFFWLKDSPFSQFHPSWFKVDDVMYCCAEQYMMYQKAVVFEDHEIGQQILETDVPPEIKALGRQVRNYDDDIWNAHCQRVVKEGNRAKFTQNPLLLKKLLATKGTTLVEASPNDTKWGIGLHEKNPKAFNRSTWRGQNLLGAILTELRDELLTEMTGSSEESNSEEEQFTFFFRKESPFSQFHPAEFKVDDVTFNCAEQYMMYQKAVVFEDHEIGQQILECDVPPQIKALGRQVRNYNDDVWNAYCQRVVKEGNRAKFTQNPHLRKALLATQGTTLVEASPRDRKWGIGLSEKNLKAHNRKTWRGQNLLGAILTELRDELIAEGAGSSGESSSDDQT
ncbi:uncharacterized protein LOC144861327 [Branchiostoma floridae x Branchiostoma japonicum]